MGVRVKADILIFDGRHLLWRTSDAFGMLSVELGGHEVGTGGIYGFLLVALRIYQRYGGRAIVAWEGRNNFRYDLYPEYKKKGEPDQDRLEFIRDMAEQEMRLKAILRSMGVDQFAGVRCEADDVMGRIATEQKAIGDHVVIYTGDSDLRQMADRGVQVIAPGRKGKDTVYDVNAVYDKHGVFPIRLADLKALAGDSSDNVPGIRGIGPKTAAKLIADYGDVEDIIVAAQGTAEKWKGPERFRQTIADSADDIRLYKELTTIRTDAGMKRIVPKPSQKRVIQHLMAYKFRSLMAPTELNGLMKMGKLVERTHR